MILNIKIFLLLFRWRLLLLLLFFIREENLIKIQLKELLKERAWSYKWWWQEILINYFHNPVLEGKKNEYTG